MSAAWRRYRVLALLLVTLAATLVLVVVSQGSPDTATPLDPDNPGPDGTRALYRVLADQGVRTEVARGADALEATQVDATTTVVVSSADSLGESTLDRLREHAASAAAVVVLEPGTATWSLLGPGSPATSGAGRGIAASCDDLGADAAAASLVGDLELETDRVTTYPGRGCFPDADGRPALLARDDVLVLGAARALTNAEVTRADNAALGLRLLGQGERLVWYVPETADLVGDDAVGIGSFLPRWIGPGLWLALAALLLLVVWRARRLGRLATEPLPVVVRAVETTLSRGRLYRRAGDRGHAARSLRAAARARLGERLGLGVHHDAQALVRDVAARTGRDPSQVASLLLVGASDPPTDPDLITLAQELDRLDREVRDA